MPKTPRTGDTLKIVPLRSLTKIKIRLDLRGLLQKQWEHKGLTCKYIIQKWLCRSYDDSLALRKFNFQQQTRQIQYFLSQTCQVHIWKRISDHRYQIWGGNSSIRILERLKVVTVRQNAFLTEKYGQDIEQQAFSEPTHQNFVCRVLKNSLVGFFLIWFFYNFVILLKSV